MCALTCTRGLTARLRHMHAGCTRAAPHCSLYIAAGMLPDASVDSAARVPLHKALSQRALVRALLPPAHLVLHVCQCTPTSCLAHHLLGALPHWQGPSLQESAGRSRKLKNRKWPFAGVSGFGGRPTVLCVNLMIPMGQGHTAPRPGFDAKPRGSSRGMGGV